MRKFTFTTAVVSTLAVASAGFAIAGAQADTADTARTSASATAGASRTVPAHTLRQFPQLSRARVARQQVNAWPISVEDVAREDPTMVVEAARVLEQNGERTFVLVPRTDGAVCLVALSATGPRTNCNTAGGAPVLVTYGVAEGVAPADVTSITYRHTDGSTSTERPDDGRFSAPPDARTMSFSSEGAKTTVDLMPAEQAPAGFRAEGL